ncbi:MAG: flagellar hook-associated protein FlgL [Gammaproteobacteria bacterium]
MRIATTQMFQQGVTNILNKQTEVANLQAQISTGKRLLTPSDDPAASAQVLSLDNADRVTEQYQRNADMVTSRLQLEEGAISTGEDIMQRIREIATQGASGQYGDKERSYMATEVRQLLDEMMGVANTRDGNGDYLFAGFKAKTQAFAVDPITGDVAYYGDQGSRVVNISPTTTVPDGDPGSDVFMEVRNGNGTFVTGANSANTGTGVINVGGVSNSGSYVAHDFRVVFTSATTYNIVDDTAGSIVASAQPYTSGGTIAFNGLNVVITGAPASGDDFSIKPSQNQSVFKTLKNLAEALETPLSSPAQRAQFTTTMYRTIADVDQTQQRFLEIRSAIGARENAIDSQKSFNDDLSVQLKGLRSSLEDADIVKAASDLNLNLTTLQAAQAAFAKMQNLSLFNYL